ncbi:hypothetical protein IH781_00480 [Patescibacteria group bacterium]|nr:hypothetical protein [Patescibacteria group bacterium]
MTLLPLLVLLAPALLGYATIVALHIFSDQVTALVTGTISGLLVAATGFYVLSLITPLTVTLLWVATVMMLGTTALVIHNTWPTWLALPFDRLTLGVLVTSIVFASVIVPNLLYQNEQGLHTNILNAWGDLGWHMSVVTSFAEGQTNPPTNPIMAGEKLTYPFLIDFLSGVLLIAGATYAPSITWPALLLLPTFFTLFFIFARVVTRSRTAALIALVLLIGSGSTLGILNLLTDLQASPSTVTNFLLHLPQDYAGTSYDVTGYYFPNIIMAALLPQRSFLLGLPAALTILILLLHGMAKDKPRAFAAAGLLAGLLPLAHAHTVIALVPMILALVMADRRRWRISGNQAGSSWRKFFFIAAVVGTPGVLYYLTSNTVETGAFLRLSLFWTAGSENPVWFWLKNTGLLVPLAVIALLFHQGPRFARLFASVGLVIFTAVNVFAFAPWIWDNYKLLLFWLIFSLPLIGWLASRLLTRPLRHFKSAKPMLISPLLTSLLVVLLIIGHIQSGAVDLLKTMLPTTPAYEDWNWITIDFAEEIRRKTAPGSVILTAPYHNSPPSLAGRPIYLGSSGHVWSHGGNPRPREQAVGPFYTNELAQLPEVTPDYIIVGPVERQQFPSLVIRPNWSLISQVGEYQLYQLLNHSWPGQ